MITLSVPVACANFVCHAHSFLLSYFHVQVLPNKCQWSYSNVGCSSLTLESFWIWFSLERYKVVLLECLIWWYHWNIKQVQMVDTRKLEWAFVSAVLTLLIPASIMQKSLVVLVVPCYCKCLWFNCKKFTDKWKATVKNYCFWVFERNLCRYTSDMHWMANKVAPHHLKISICYLWYLPQFNL